MTAHRVNHLRTFLLLSSLVFLAALPAVADDATTAKPAPPASAQPPSTSVQPAPAALQSLQQRVQDYWNYRVSEQLEKAYLLEDPNVRKKLSLRDYLLTIGADIKYLKFQIGTVTVQENTAQVLLTLRIASMISPYNPKGGRKRIFKDQWIRVNNEWYHGLVAKPGKKPAPANNKQTAPAQQAKTAETGKGLSEAAVSGATDNQNTPQP